MVNSSSAAEKAAAVTRVEDNNTSEHFVANGVAETISVTASTKQQEQDGKRPSKNNPGRPQTQDSAHALLSLGNDLSNSGEEELVDGPPAAVGEGAKNRKLEEGTSTTPAAAGTAETSNGQGTPKDFWYWLPENQSVGDWDVLCGRGGESNNYVGNKKYRIVIKEKKVEYRKIDPKHRKQKTAFVRDVVQHINQCGGRFIDVDDLGRRYVVTMEKARKKTSQALRETKELKWLNYDQKSDKKGPSQKDIVCPFCKKIGHKTRIAKACLFHHQWLDAGKPNGNGADINQNPTSSPVIFANETTKEQAKGTADAALSPNASATEDVNVQPSSRHELQS
ncbi:hypothetical protein IV203_029776 [Nitzschia inconspicua]|uniref:DUF6824 domain-containing protein n=1 Tax=Nitzschia inconspicua TaxID=303405 RepID=A0A9K3K810_9STRA|nr:hypothetical protein IV203_004857 [Nitzschia inconspicua]KAG7367106.1 hypothetical protein IV203_029776 [Nitzschia inconspicua]